MTTPMTLMILYVLQEPEEGAAFGPEPSALAPRDSEGKEVEDKRTAAAVRKAKSRAKKAQQETSAERDARLRSGEIDNVFLLQNQTDRFYKD